MDPDRAADAPGRGRRGPPFLLPRRKGKALIGKRFLCGNAQIHRSAGETVTPRMGPARVFRYQDDVINTSLSCRSGTPGAMGRFAALAALALIGGCESAVHDAAPIVVAPPPETPVVAGTLPDVAVTPEPTTRESAELTGRAWYVTTVKDPTTRSYTAAIERRSLDQLSFDTPYDGDQRASMTLVLHDGQPVDLVISIERGRFVCAGKDRDTACALRVSIDDAAPRPVRFAVPRHFPPTELHLAGGPDARRLLAVLTRAKRLRIQPIFQQERSPEIEFALTGLSPAIARISKHSVAELPGSPTSASGGG